MPIEREGSVWIIQPDIYLKVIGKKQWEIPHGRHSAKAWYSPGGRRVWRHMQTKEIPD